MEKTAQAVLKIDTAIIEALPKESKVLAIEQYGTSSWASTARLETEMVDGTTKAYFVKILKAHDAAERVSAEYMSMSEIYNTLPTFAPQPHGYGECKDNDAHFFLCDYLPIDHELPDPVRLGEKLAELHRKSESPTRQFGFHCITFDGMLPLNTAWNSSWTSFFQTLMRDITLEKLIPRLLDPLTAEGRSIKPCLIHGDLWASNIGTDVQTGEIYIYDACAYYGHHEKEVGIWRCEHHQMHDEDYRNEYFKNFEPSEPVEEFDDRNRLYSVEALFMNSAHFLGR